MYYCEICLLLLFRAMPPGRRFQEGARKRHAVNCEGNREDSTRSYCTRQGVGQREPRHDTGASRRWSLETSRKGRRNEQSRERQQARKATRFFKQIQEKTTMEKKRQDSRTRQTRVCFHERNS